LVNFIGVNAAMGLRELELSFDNIDKPIIQIYGRNRCGKTVLIQQLHPFSSINLNGDERSDLSLVIPHETGIKCITYEVNGEVYNITHTYKPTSSGNHTISSSLRHNDEELNPSGGVTIFNNLIEKLLGINKYVFQFVINGTQLTSFANMSATQRKSLLNKAMGIDIYDKIHKMAKDDYRYTNKLITSLNNTKEYLLSTYGSYETLCSLMNNKQRVYDDLSKSILNIKSRIDSLNGQITVIRNQNISQELSEVSHILNMFENTVKEIGIFDTDSYDKLVDEQISLNAKISSLKNERLLIMKDKDVLYSKKNDIENTIMMNKQSMNDYNEMVNLKDDLKRKIDDIHVETFVTSSSNYLMSMRSLGQAVNSICKEIVMCLNDKHLNMFAQMIINGVDISAFLIQEGSALMDGEKEKSVVSRIRNMINGIDGEYIDDCCHEKCLYKRTHEMLDTYFKSYQSVSSSKFTTYDMEQFDHAYKNIQTLKRLINVEISDELKEIFNLSTIMSNLVDGNIGVDVHHIQYLMEESAKIEQRNKYISQLSDVEKQIENIKKVMIPTDNADQTLTNISQDIESLNNILNEKAREIDELTNVLSVNDKRRMMLSQIQHINIVDTKNRYDKLTKLNETLVSSENEYSQLTREYNDMVNQLNIISNELKVLNDAYNQYNNTVDEIKKYQLTDNKYKIIAEATSSTKGKPVIAIRDKVNEALLTTNRLLNVMYDDEIEMLSPDINESTFTLPFRCGGNISQDIRFGSQSESTLLSLALSLSLASSLTPYNVNLVDELDAYLDTSMRDGFILMLQEVMSTLKMEQLFIISHNISPGQYEHIVHTIDISKEIMKEGE
jgi:DNA repair exonuclease SbcCD ATPase subunit